MKLHLGCGSKILSGFLNVDIRPGLGVDIVDDVTTLKTIENNSVDLIYACHVLEHINRHSVLKVLQRWYDVLAPKGMIRIAVPDFEAVVSQYKQGTHLKTLMGLLYGGQNYTENYHHYCWDFNTLSEDLSTVGFIDIKRYDWKKTEHRNTDDYSQCYLPHMDKENGMLMSLNVEGTKNG